MSGQKSDAAMLPATSLTTAIAAELPNYPGAKGGSGVWQAIITQIPPHRIYYEIFAGTAQVFCRKRPAEFSVLVDCSVKASQAWGRVLTQTKAVCLTDDAIHFLELFNREARGNGAVVYLDPPYLGSTRADPRRNYYEHEFKSYDDHLELLHHVRGLKTRVILSGYPNALYDSALQDWRFLDIPAVNRAGNRVIERLWMNYPQPKVLHEYTYLGKNFRERERIKRKKQRWMNRLARMPVLERAGILDAVTSFIGESEEG